MTTPRESTTSNSAGEQQADLPSTTAGKAEFLDSQQTSLEAASLAAHLQRVGIRWLPTANPQATAEFASRFDPSPEADVPTSPTVDVETQDKSDKSQVAPQNSNEITNSAASPATSGLPAPNRPPSVRPPTRLHGVSAIQTDAGAYSGPALETHQRFEQLQQLENTVSLCTQCATLASCRNKTVFGEGSPNPRFAFFGEGPGEQEDLTGRPFVGAAGQLLTKMIEACTLKREDVYILNTVKCRPPGNRNPEGDELENCRAFYQQQLDLLRPEYIVCLGAVSAQELLTTKLSVGRLRGTLHQYFASKVLVTYHPAYLIRNPAAKKAAWADLQMLMRDAGLKPKAK